MPRPLEATSDHDLCWAWQSGDPHAGAELYQRHQPSLRNFLARRLGRDPEDTAQDVWVAVSSALHRYQRRSSFRTWVFAIANNHVRVAHRSEARTLKIEAAAMDLRPTHADEEPERVCNERDALRRLTVALGHLPRSLRRIVDLYYFEEQSAAAIGRRMSLPENTVRSRVRRARLILAEALGSPAAAQLIAA